MFTVNAIALLLVKLMRCCVKAGWRGVMKLPIAVVARFSFLDLPFLFRARLWHSHVLMIPLCIVFSAFTYFLESEGVNATKLHDTFALGK